MTGPVTIDGTTQPGFSGTPIIELDGASAAARRTASSSPPATASSAVWSSTVSGPVDRLRSRPPATAGGIVLAGAGNNVVEGNWIGTDLDGHARAAGTATASWMNGAGEPYRWNDGRGANVISGNTSWREIGRRQRRGNSNRILGTTSGRTLQVTSTSATRRSACVEVFNSAQTLDRRAWPRRAATSSPATTRAACPQWWRINEASGATSLAPTRPGRRPVTESASASASASTARVNQLRRRRQRGRGERHRVQHDDWRDRVVIEHEQRRPQQLDLLERRARDRSERRRRHRQRRRRRGRRCQQPSELPGAHVPHPAASRARSTASRTRRSGSSSSVTRRATRPVTAKARRSSGARR